MTETPARLEPMRLSVVPENTAGLAVELSASSARLGSGLHVQSAANLAALVRVMNAYYTNLIEGHNTRPRDIERAMSGDLDVDGHRRDLQLEAVAHVRLQASLDELAASDELSEPASAEFLSGLHKEFYRDAPAGMLTVEGQGSTFLMCPGQWRFQTEHDVAVGRHLPPSSAVVERFIQRFSEAYELEHMKPGQRLLLIPAAHHRFNFIHPFPDGNGRVSRLMSHAMAHWAGVGAHGLWSVSRGLARGLESTTEYALMMDHADSPRQGDLDGRGNLSEKALQKFTHWFLEVCLDQVDFMSAQFELHRLDARYDRLVATHDTLKPESSWLLKEALRSGQFDRGQASRITGLPTRTAQRVLKDVINEGLLASETPKGPVSLRFPLSTLDTLFPKLYSEV